MKFYFILSYLSLQILCGECALICHIWENTPNDIVILFQPQRITLADNSITASLLTGQGHSHIYTYGQIKVSSPPVFEIWEETWERQGNPRKHTSCKPDTESWSLGMNLNVLRFFLDLCTLKAISTSSLQEKACYVLWTSVYIKLQSLLQICLFHHDRNCALGVTSCCADGSAESCRTLFGPIELRLAS